MFVKRLHLRLILSLVVISTLLFISFSAASPFGSQIQPAKALNNGLALKPPMGWSSWNLYGDVISETKIKQMADAMVSSGMQTAGYQYINIDEGWWTQQASPNNGGRDASGNIMPDLAKFPN